MTGRIFITDVAQLAILAKSEVFITHCGRNSVSESLYMAAPMVLYLQTNEQHAAAGKVAETGAGIMLKDGFSKGIHAAVQEILNGKTYENTPHSSNSIDIIDKWNKANTRFQFLYWLIVIVVINLIIWQTTIM